MSRISKKGHRTVQTDGAPCSPSMGLMRKQLFQREFRYRIYQNVPFFIKELDIQPLIDSGKLKMTLPEKPKSSKQKYVRT